jgi:hypothetical protein
MVFILAADGRDGDVVGAFRRYRDYLRSARERFPPLAFALATSDWYFDFREHRCPHDAWLEALAVTETPSDGEKKRSSSLNVRLLGPYHDGHIELRYPQIFGYSLNASGIEHGHSDWRYDELRVSESGHLLHEIEWRGIDETSRWLIEASDLEYRWFQKR